MKKTKLINFPKWCKENFCNLDTILDNYKGMPIKSIILIGCRTLKFMHNKMSRPLVASTKTFLGHTLNNTNPKLNKFNSFNKNVVGEREVSRSKRCRVKANIS